jgi:hypothetical protein
VLEARVIGPQALDVLCRVDDSVGFTPQAYAWNLDCACALTLAASQAGDPQAEQRRGQPGSPWLFHQTRDGEHGEGQACPVGQPMA